MSTSDHSNSPDSGAESVTSQNAEDVDKTANEKVIGDGGGGSAAAVPPKDAKSATNIPKARPARKGKKSAKISATDESDDDAMVEHTDQDADASTTKDEDTKDNDKSGSGTTSAAKSTSKLKTKTKDADPAEETSKGKSNRKRKRKDTDAGEEATSATEGTKKRTRRGARPQAVPGLNPSWWAPVMCTLMVVGLLWIVVFYLLSDGTKDTWPIPGIGYGNLAIGFGLIMAGFLMTTRWK